MDESEVIIGSEQTVEEQIFKLVSKRTLTRIHLIFAKPFATKDK